MQIATKQDKNKIIEIIAESFRNNPSVLWVVKNDKHKTQRIKALAEYAFNNAMRRNGVYISADKEGVAICYEYNKYKDSLADYIDQIKLASKCIGLFRVKKVLTRDNVIKQKRNYNNRFLYFWFWGISDAGKGKSSARESKDFIFEKSKQSNLPIFLETSVIKNKIVYERYGFEVFETLDYDNTTIYLMKREPIFN